MLLKWVHILTFNVAKMKRGFMKCARCPRYPIAHCRAISKWKRIHKNPPFSPSKNDSEMCKSKINCIIRHRSEPEGRTNNRVDSASTVSCLDTTLSALIMALIPLAKDLQLEPHFHVLSGACQVEPGALYGP